MYNPIPIEKFADKVHKEASEAAQRVYDKYTPELYRLVSNQLQKGDVILRGMGTVTFEKDKPYGYAENLLQVLTNLEYHDKVEAGFGCDDYIKIND